MAWSNPSGKSGTASNIGHRASQHAVEAICRRVGRQRAPPVPGPVRRPSAVDARPPARARQSSAAPAPVPGFQHTLAGAGGHRGGQQNRLDAAAEAVCAAGGSAGVRSAGDPRSGPRPVHSRQALPGLAQHAAGPRRSRPARPSGAAGLRRCCRRATLACVSSTGRLDAGVGQQGDQERQPDRIVGSRQRRASRGSWPDRPTLFPATPMWCRGLLAARSWPAWTRFSPPPI